MVQWQQPKKGLFMFEGRQWVSGTGWKKEIRQLTIVGETEDSYVFNMQLIETGKFDEWGIAKNRLVHWVPVQLELW